MKRSFLDIINIFLSIILGLLITSFILLKYKNKEFEKIFWNAEIVSIAEKKTTNNTVIIKIIDASFYNNFEEYSTKLDYESIKNSIGFINTNEERNIEFQSSGEKLFPDSLNLKYFSVEERKFYQLSTKIDYEKWKNLIKKSTEIPLISIQILPKGQTKLNLNYKNKKTETIEKFLANEFDGNINMLVYRESLGQKFIYLDDINNVIDFSDLLQNKYNWILKTEIEDNERLEDVSAKSFAQETINLSQKNNNTLQLIPRDFHIKWGIKQKYGIKYYFNPLEILNAFRILSKTNNNEPIVLTFILTKEKYPVCKINKKDKTILLKNIYPELPIKYAN
ncbi:MAG TPA: hypothetical protein DEQ26_05915 [Flavobacteriaceae bacterium]|nr:hypothetical protein [Flavobacteriaceae bacterium]